MIVTARMGDGAATRSFRRQRAVAHRTCSGRQLTLSKQLDLVRSERSSDQQRTCLVRTSITGIGRRCALAGGAGKDETRLT